MSQTLSKYFRLWQIVCHFSFRFAQSFFMQLIDREPQELNIPCVCDLPDIKAGIKASSFVVETT